ncbi:hypothetical protein TpMuguga_02g00049 [Theileria parva strain Muguga]|uniref:Uncharacterized protein n=1 Tax=Theileria parva TaxID=5875 RepID=Q4N688_THEPA|nr:uncharacterized protein TpMuguga_02g00049 [Theileria parva strain Muguga]EAN32335.1 hypothetical protein TpMuguga_02g00049 [Theileria parva strain Muguga]|eukprot:XP_764618.1 hypothetical protein [Theileria parva strain Muguga]
MQRLGIDNPEIIAGDIERPVSSKRPLESEGILIRGIKRLRENTLTLVQTLIEILKSVFEELSEIPSGQTLITEFIPTVNSSLSSFSYQSPHSESTNEDNSVVTDVIGMSLRNIAGEFKENIDKFIFCKGYKETFYTFLFLYKLIESVFPDYRTSVSSRHRANINKITAPKSIYFYKEEKIIFFEILNIFIGYKLENGYGVVGSYKIPEITLYRRVNGELVPLTRDQYSDYLTLAGGTQWVIRVREELECVRAMIGDHIVWTKETYLKGFLVTLLYKFADDSIVVEAGRLFKFTKYNKMWIEKTQIPFLLTHYAKDEIDGFIPVFIENVSIDDKNKYILDYTNEPNFDMVKYRDKTICRHQPGQSFPKSMSCYSNLKTFEFKFDDKFITYLLKGNELIEKHHHIPPVTLLSQDNEGNTRELSSDDYNLQMFTKGGIKFVYTLSHGVCTLIKYYDRVIWSRNTGEKPLYVVYRQETGRLEVIFEDKILLFDSKNPNSIVQTIEIPPELTLHKRNDQGETVKLSPLEYRVQTSEKTGLKYTPNDDIICTELRHNNRVVWKYTEGVHKPLSFTYFFKTKKKITVKFHYKPSLKYQLQNDE